MLFKTIFYPVTDICKEKDKPGFQLNLTGAMIFSDHIFMMDSNLLVYKVPKSSYDGSYGKMVMNIKGIPIEEYWPPFKGNKLWECVKKQYKTIYHLINGNTGEIVINIFVHMDLCEYDNGSSYVSVAQCKRRFMVKLVFYSVVAGLQLDDTKD